MKYRMLTMEELGFLEEELKQFLIVNGVHGDEWEKLCSHERDKAEKLIAMFSDNVLQTVYERIKFLEFRTEDLWVLMQILDEIAESITIKCKEGSGIDLSSDAVLDNVFEHYRQEIEVFRASKRHKLSREEEVHNLIMSGCVPSSSDRWLALDKLIPART